MSRRTYDGMSTLYQSLSTFDRSAPEADTVWGLMAVLARFVNSFVFMGTSKALGVLIPHLVNYFDAPVGPIGLCCSMFAGLPHVSGLFTTFLVKQLGERSVIMIGGAITFVGLLSAAFSPNVPLLGISLAAAGLANGLCIVAGIMPINWYFPDKFAIMNGIALSGGAIGMMIMPPLTETLINWYGWRGAMVLLASISSHCVLAGAVIKSPKCPAVSNVAECDQQDEMEDAMALQEIQRNLCDYLKDVARRVKNQLTSELFQMYQYFFQLQIVFMLSGAALAAWTLYLVPGSIEKGISALHATYLSTIGGIGHIIGRVLQGPLVDYDIIKDTQLFAIMSTLCCLAFLTDRWLEMYYTAALSAFTVGFATGMQYTLCFSIIKTTVIRGDLLLAAMGWAHLFIGIGKVAAGPAVGFLFDATGKYFSAFVALGGLEIVIVIIIFRLEMKRSSCFIPGSREATGR